MLLPLGIKRKEYYKKKINTNECVVYQFLIWYPIKQTDDKN